MMCSSMGHEAACLRWTKRVQPITLLLWSPGGGHIPINDVPMAGSRGHAPPMNDEPTDISGSRGRVPPMTGVTA